MSANTRRALSLSDKIGILENRKRKRCGKDDTVERALKEWFVKVRNKDARVSGPLLCQKAEELAEKIRKVNFKATDGWFHRWKKRENISFQKTHEEQGDADFVGTHFWLENEWPFLISEYLPSDVFNANETAKGTKTCKERMTLMCCASMTGEKEKLRKSKQPRCFKRVKALPMTQEIFSQWLIKWDNELSRKILLLVDNYTAHNLKAYFRSKIRKRIITLLDKTLEYESTSTLKANDLAKKINILEALHLANEPWNNINHKELTDKTHVDWMNIDNDLQTSEEYSEDQICQSIANESTIISREK
ncbi:Homeobox domain-like,HTH CenpB-type DNA-binding domain [Cinara cedri]|uniref:Homeobox domain-like,HTH CenpB-type DNA-binding domain n=1 Tax=Cinara cedri TaxID=506608 RepID=A0A5E4MGT2_9HEMI|nr:Homeobox domain-like,HTH CenpB-type DNA-binding domain [Cinara cedri]